MRNHHMNRIAYFNNAATTYPKPEEVYNFVDNYYRKSGINSARVRMIPSQLIQDTRKLILDLFHCPAKRCIFTLSN